MTAINVLAGSRAMRVVQRLHGTKIDLATAEAAVIGAMMLGAVVHQSTSRGETGLLRSLDPLIIALELQA
jgi:hypothetical protein